MKIFLTILAWLGLALMIAGTVLESFPTLTYLGAPEEIWGQPELYFEWTSVWYILAFIAALPGVILELIGGLIARPRYLWIGLLVVGLAYCLIFLTGIVYTEFKQQAYPELYAPSPGSAYTATQIIFALSFLSPGLVSIIEGIILRVLEKKKKRNRGIIEAMKRELMGILVCPVCKGELKLTVTEEKEEIINGSLHCPKCRLDYPITNSIPNLLPPEQRA